MGNMTKVQEAIFWGEEARRLRCEAIDESDESRKAYLMKVAEERQKIADKINKEIMAEERAKWRAERPSTMQVTTMDKEDTLQMIEEHIDWAIRKQKAHEVRYAKGLRIEGIVEATLVLTRNEKTSKTKTNLLWWHTGIHCDEWAWIEKDRTYSQKNTMVRAIIARANPQNEEETDEMMEQMKAMDMIAEELTKQVVEMENAIRAGSKPNGHWITIYPKGWLEEDEWEDATEEDILSEEEKNTQEAKETLERITGRKLTNEEFEDWVEKTRTALGWDK